MLAVVGKRASVSLLDNDVLSLHPLIECEGGAQSGIGALRKDAGVGLGLGLVGGEDLEHGEALKGIILACGCGVNEDRNTAGCRNTRRVERGLEGDLKAEIECIGLTVERLVDIVERECRVSTGINDNTVVAVALLHHDCQTRLVLAVDLDVGGVDALLLVVLIELLTVEVRAYLGTEAAIRTELLKSDGGIRTLTAGNVSNTAVVDKRLARRRHLIHIHRQIHICTADNKNFLISHFLFFLLGCLKKSVLFLKCNYAIFKTITVLKRRS